MGTVFENRLATARSASPRHGLKDMIPGTASTQLTRWLSEEVDEIRWQKRMWRLTPRSGSMAVESPSQARGAARVAAPAAKCTWCGGTGKERRGGCGGRGSTSSEPNFCGGSGTKR